MVPIVFNQSIPLEKVFIKTNELPITADYNVRPWSYKDLPKRYANWNSLQIRTSGELHGLTRVRGFTQDDAHIFVLKEQLDEEFKKVIDLVLYVFGSLGFKTAQISLRDKENRDKYRYRRKLGKKQKMLLSMLQIKV
jgi:threonyl-tRNA synthetase